MRPAQCLAWLGEPDLQIVGFRLWVLGRQLPHATDPWDRDWLNVTAQCEAAGASVHASGSFVLLSSVESWATNCEKLHAGRVDEAVLYNYEPELSAAIRREGRLGHLILRVELTPAYLQQGHWFEFEIDQSYLPLIVSQCRAIVREHPVRVS